jgi:hypothetical protein
MYNLNSHYENILSYAKSIITQPAIVYLHPFGSTQPENIESLQNGGFGPLIIAYDQEPLYHYYNSPLFTFIKKKPIFELIDYTVIKIIKRKNH